MINLYDYILSYDFLKQVKESVTIVSDYESPHSLPAHITFLSLEQVVAQSGEQQGNFIIILKYAGSYDILQLQKFFPVSCVRINLNPGLRSLIEKNNNEENDITLMLNHHYHVKEPKDQQDFLSSLQEHRIYIRIHNVFLPQTLAEKTSIGGILALQTSGESLITVITNPGSIDKVSSTLYLLREQEAVISDIFVQTEFSNSLNEEIINSITTTQKIIIILDHKATQEIIFYYESLILHYFEKKDISIHFVFPQFHLVQSILEEYIEEEAHFDDVALTNYLNSIVRSQHAARH